ncbi:hypothetical protein OHA84_36350 [Streptomyces sp. NBC_00513]|uniref:hypothetical protein n=1 Tax=unclassified Streptomyces TaxID=2593676 RepID=UPI002250D5A4|nr:hypothetical protein [Streptomyces sp. NBC_00424]MCX5071024.1 hypothetical protein [Streptomyces sp. NBC_00424]WUD45542.1 hypothetical protein OHA84_36350 [Streptomyces sp. NBC_00513]
MLHTPRTIDDLLARARVFQGDYTPAHLDAARERLINHLNEARWSQLLVGAPALPPAQASRPAALHEQAAHQLWALSQNVITDTEAADYIARFQDGRDPGGALAFACLLDLAHIEDGAQFWWQFAAGAGNPTGALCLYLLHLRRGEMRDARHWAGQIGVLEGDDDGEITHFTPVPHEQTQPTAPAVGITMRYETRTAPDDISVSDEAVKDTVDQLGMDRHEELGRIHTPTADLAKQIGELATH